MKNLKKSATESDDGVIKPYTASHDGIKQVFKIADQKEQVRKTRPYSSTENSYILT